jgi:hypothetical protein
MQEFFTKNIGLKLLALTIAVSIELYFISPRNLMSQTIKVPVQIRNVPPKRIIVSPSGVRDGFTTEVKVRGPSPLLQQLQTSSYRFFIDIPPSALESYSHRFEPQSLPLPPGVEVTEITPPKLDLKLEPLVSKSLAVVCEFVGEPPAGYRLESKQILPSSLIVHGPMSALRGLRELPAHKVDLSKLTEPVELELPVAEFDPLVTLDVNVVTVQLNIQPKIERRTFSKVKLLPRGEPTGPAVLESPSVKVTLSGPVKKIAELKEDDIHAVVDFSGLSEGKHQVPVMVSPVSGFTIQQVAPETVPVIVGKSGG